MTIFHKLMCSLTVVSSLASCAQQDVELEDYEIEQTARLNCILHADDNELRIILQAASKDYQAFSNQLTLATFEASGSTVSAEYGDWFIISTNHCDTFKPIIDNFIESELPDNQLNVKITSKEDYIKVYKKDKLRESQIFSETTTP